MALTRVDAGSGARFREATGFRRAVPLPPRAGARARYEPEGHEDPRRGDDEGAVGDARHRVEHPVVVEVHRREAHQREERDARDPPRRAKRGPPLERDQARVGAVQAGHRAEHVGRATVHAREVRHPEPRVDAREVRALAGARVHVDDAAVRVVVPGRRRRVEVVGHEAGQVEREEAPGEAHHPRVVAHVEPGRAGEAHEDERAVRDGADAVEEGRSVRLEPVVQRDALALTVTPKSAISRARRSQRCTVSGETPTFSMARIES